MAWRGFSFEFRFEFLVFDHSLLVSSRCISTMYVRDDVIVSMIGSIATAQTAE